MLIVFYLLLYTVSIIIQQCHKIFIWANMSYCLEPLVYKNKDFLITNI